MLSIVRILSANGGVARVATFQEAGVHRVALSRLVRQGKLLRPRHGVVALPGVHPEVLTAAAHGGMLTCLSALRLLGVWVLNEDHRPHVWLGRNHHAHPHEGCECVNHRYRGNAGEGRVSLTTALAHALRCAGDEAFFVALESALRQGMLSAKQREELRHLVPTSALWLLNLAQATSDSGLESLLRLRLHLMGLRLRAQVTLPGVGRVDFMVGRLIIEADGKENHAAPNKRHKDLVRDAAASQLGFETLRFDYAQIIHDWPTVQAAIAAALLRAA